MERKMGMKDILKVVSITTLTFWALAQRLILRPALEAVTYPIFLLSAKTWKENYANTQSSICQPYDLLVVHKSHPHHFSNVWHSL